ncbi:alpha-1,6-xylosyltransferase [Trifolium pratense]|uniref:Alpha-1,6-xylosyltransferase n=1 Tax=Trifolium pratense TaxID=57577 RepID=A0A2K3LDZ7_TRIPR|nr:alpha-1,6-xylosyltransferase [Trifolium pratense]
MFFPSSNICQVCGIEFWLLVTVRWPGGWRLGDRVVLRGGRLRKSEMARALRVGEGGGVSVSVKYMRLFDLSINKSSTVRMGGRRGGLVVVPPTVGVGGGDIRGMLFRNRLPTKDNLVRRNIITHSSQFCVTGCGGLKTSRHVFLSCSVLCTLVEFG